MNLVMFHQAMDGAQAVTGIPLILSTVNGGIQLDFTLALLVILRLIVLVMVW